MLIVAVIGLGVNLISMRLLSGGTDGSLNVKGAYLEVWSDMLGSLGVIAAAILIRLTGWTQADPIIAVLIGLWVLPRTWTLLSESVNVLLEGVPEGIVLQEVETALLTINGVVEVHDLHIWAITTGRNSLTAHLRLRAGSNATTVLREAATMVADRFQITHITIQIEQDGPCRSSDCVDPERSSVLIPKRVPIRRRRSVAVSIRFVSYRRRHEYCRVSRTESSCTTVRGETGRSQCRECWKTSLLDCLHRHTIRTELRSETFCHQTFT